MLAIIIESDLDFSFSFLLSIPNNAISICFSFFNSFSIFGIFLVGFSSCCDLYIINPNNPTKINKNNNIAIIILLFNFS